MAVKKKTAPPKEEAPKEAPKKAKGKLILKRTVHIPNVSGKGQPAQDNYPADTVVTDAMQKAWDANCAKIGSDAKLSDRCY